MRRVPGLILLFAIATPCLAAPPAVVEIPRDKPGEWSEIKAAPGRLLRLGAEPASKWLLVDEDAVDLAVFDAGKSAAFCSPAVGRFKLIVTSPDGTPARVVIVVGTDPGPPNPKPPAPPIDHLKDKLKKAFADDPDPKKGEHAKDLAALYRQAAKLTVSAEVATAADLLARVKAAGTSLVGADALKGVRGVVGGELSVIFPTDGPIAEGQRMKARDLFIKMADILDGF